MSFRAFLSRLFYHTVWFILWMTLRISPEKASSLAKPITRRVCIQLSSNIFQRRPFNASPTFGPVNKNQKMSHTLWSVPSKSFTMEKWSRYLQTLVWILKIFAIENLCNRFFVNLFLSLKFNAKCLARPARELATVRIRPLISWYPAEPAVQNGLKGNRIF